MDNSFLDMLNAETSVKLTENGAIAYSTTLDAVLDLFALGASYRSRPHEDVFTLFGRAFTQDPVLATKALFYIRDIRGGQGERRFFRECLPFIFSKFTGKQRMLFLDLVEEYGRIDDMFCVYGPEVASWIKNRFWNDNAKMLAGKPISLLAKWLPSENASSKETTKLAHRVIKDLGITPNEYRRRLSAMRKHLKVVECDMTANRWQDIDYPGVPSQAMLKYKKAFHKHDEARFTDYKAAVAKGDEKINTGTLYPYQIVEKALNERGEDTTTDLLWDNLPDYVPKGQKAIVVADTSGSMYDGNDPAPIYVSLSLALYFAQRNVGPFANALITFSRNPKLQLIPAIGSLYDKLKAMDTGDWAMNTNIDLVFQLLLRVALDNDVAREDIPQTIYVVSDMEFDRCMYGADIANFEYAKRMWAEHGLELPNVVFWNVRARNDTLPVRYNEQGVALVSGASPSIFKQAMSQTTPAEFMVEVLSAERYRPVEGLFK